MKLYFAPLEGITTAIYRKTHASMFDGVDAYYAPFINPSENSKISKKGMKDILPENNIDINTVPQILTANSDSFLRFIDKIEPFGYDEININIGCPASTVVRKGRGAGFLQYPYLIDKFLDGIFGKCDMKISVKTRIGYSDTDEFDDIIPIYNKYPISLLIIHPRTRDDLYKGVPHIDVFEKAYNNCANKLCYNGDVNSLADYARITEQFPNLDSVMLGRGAIANPALFREIKGGKPITTKELINFSELLIKNYYEVLQSDTFTLHKIKENWVYIIRNFPDEKKIAKAIKKSNTLAEFTSAIHCLPEIRIQ